MTNNGKKEFLNDMDLEKEMDDAIARGGIKELVKFGVRQNYETRKDVAMMQKDIDSNKTRSCINRWSIIIIVTLLATYGVLDASIFHVLFGG